MLNDNKLKKNASRYGLNKPSVGRSNDNIKKNKAKILILMLRKRKVLVIFKEYLSPTKDRNHTEFN